jgi:hypothetical protein
MGMHLATPRNDIFPLSESNKEQLVLQVTSQIQDEIWNKNNISIKL